MIRLLLSRLAHSRLHRSARGARRMRRQVRPAAEVLETRVLPAVFTVAMEADVVDPDDGQLSLREAVAAANADAGFDEIEFSADLPQSARFELAQGSLVIQHDLAIRGLGQGRITISGASQTRVLEIVADAAVTITDLSITSGNAGAADGGGISNHGTLASERVTLSGNSASNGGAVANFSAATLTDVIISGNSAAEEGGGLWNAPRATITFNGAEIHDNRASGDQEPSFPAPFVGQGGGGIFNDGGTVTITEWLSEKLCFL